MAGIYIHIPFCRQSCYYCDFYFTTSQRLRESFVHAVCREAELAAEYLQNEKIHTLYFGGGTPSQLRDEELERILNEMYRLFDVHAAAEVTLEANPDDITRDKLRAWKRAGINRLSIGIQSFAEADLKWMNRAHTAAEAEACVKLAQDAGFGNITIDLIYGVPGMLSEHWQQNLERFRALDIPHLSAYALTVESNTPLDKLIRQGRYRGTDDELAGQHFEQLMDFMNHEGFLHYEISNFARDVNWVSKHNAAYWMNVPYLGLGPSAHSYNVTGRRWNVAQLQKYLDAIAGNTLPVTEEVLTDEQRYNEFVLTRLRTMWGIAVAEMNQQFGTQRMRHLEQEAEIYLKQGQLELADGVYRLTRAGKLYADRIASALFA